MFWARSHQTVAFCLRIRATYDVGLFVAMDRPEVERRGTLEVDAVVPCRCTFIVLDAEEWRECEAVEGPRLYP